MAVAFDSRNSIVLRSFCCRVHVNDATFSGCCIRITISVALQSMQLAAALLYAVFRFAVTIEKRAT